MTLADREVDALAFAKWNATKVAAAHDVTVCQLDWGADTVPGAFDIVVLADVSYRPVHHLALERHLKACLATDGVVVHADPERREATPFVKWLQSHYCTVTKTKDTSFMDKRVGVRLCIASRSEAVLQRWHAALRSGPQSLSPSASDRVE